jgi:uncharacterized protein
MLGPTNELISRRRPRDGSIPPGVGVGLKHEHAQDILEGKAAVDFFEVHAENYMGKGGPPHDLLSRIRAEYPVSVHGVGLSIGGAGPLDRAHLGRLRALLDRYQPSLFSEHLAWSSHGELFLNDLLPLPYHEGTLRRVCDHIDEVQDALATRMLLENPSTYLVFETTTMSEIEFLREVVRRTGCGLLLDVNNVYVCAINHGFAPEQYIDAFPVEHVGEIHLGGFAEDGGGEGRLLIDDHGRPVADAVWALHRRALARTGPVATLIEWDNNVPTFAALAEEVVRARVAFGVGPATARKPNSGVRPSNEDCVLDRSDTEDHFAASLLDPEAPLPASLSSADGRSVRRRFAVHRNNVAAGLINALTSRYPVVQRLVGEDFFRAMARVYVTSEPPRSPILSLYGETFPAFLETFPPATAIEYLADVARLEFARGCAYHAADRLPLGNEVFTSLDRVGLAKLRFLLHPSLSLVGSRFPIVSIWKAHQGDEIGPIEDWRAEAALVIRPVLEVEVWRLPPGGLSFLSRLADGATLSLALEAGSAAAADFDVTANLAVLFGAKAVVGVSTVGVSTPASNCIGVIRTTRPVTRSRPTAA